ncbi:hypothetical protein LMBV_020 [Largemouth bass virus]|uniref:Uncharacterized protein n=1 Tax=Largemouth bass virus TaxID=176656 RepID=A0A9X7TN23_9VIRU|nr:hypothetical protein OA88_22895 [Flavobacterium sp. JRM]QJE49083.1 hypothetical protein LMBV_020 [Largemouth bass virus]QJE49169.1 hypothetical protein LMBV_020 [Largemouth bass virus]
MLLDLSGTVTINPILIKPRKRRVCKTTTGKHRDCEPAPVAVEAQPVSLAQEPDLKDDSLERRAKRKDLTLTKEMLQRLKDLDKDMEEAASARQTLSEAIGIPLDAMPGREAMGVLSMAKTMGFLDPGGGRPNFLKDMLFKCIDTVFGSVASQKKPSLCNVPRGYRRLKQSCGISPVVSQRQEARERLDWTEAAKVHINKKLHTVEVALAERELTLEPYDQDPSALERSALQAYVELADMALETNGQELLDIAVDCRVLRNCTEWCRDLSQTLRYWWPPLIKMLDKLEAKENLACFLSEREIEVATGSGRIRVLSSAILYGVSAHDGMGFCHDKLQVFDIDLYVKRLGGAWLHHARLPDYAALRMFDPRPGAEPVLIRTCAGYLMTEERGPLRCWRKDAHMYAVSVEIHGRLTRELEAVPPSSRYGHFNARWLKAKGWGGLQKIILDAARKLTEPRLSWNDVFEV